MNVYLGAIGETTTNLHLVNKMCTNVIIKQAKTQAKSLHEIPHNQGHVGINT